MVKVQALELREAVTPSSLNPANGLTVLPVWFRDSWRKV